METLKGKYVRVREGEWHYRFHFRGRDYSGPTGLAGAASNRIAAEAMALRMRTELAEKRLKKVAVARPIASATTFAATATEFLDWCRDVEYHAKPATAERIRVSFQSAIEFFGETPVGRIDGQAIGAYKSHRIKVHQVREITVRHDLHALSVYWKKWLISKKLAKSNPVDEVTIPSDRDAVREHILTAEEEHKYFAAIESLHAKYVKSFPGAPSNLGDLARILIDQGCRPEEALAVRQEHFDAAAGTLRIAGGKSRAARRTLYLTAASIEILKGRVNGGEWLFPSDRHPGHHLSKLTSAHDRACREAGVSFVLYDLRHTFATRAIEKNVPVAVVAAILGHSSLRTIHRYVHPSSAAQREAMRIYQEPDRKLKVVV